MDETRWWKILLIAIYEYIERYVIEDDSLDDAVEEDNTCTHQFITNSPT